MKREKSTTELGSSHTQSGSVRFEEQDTSAQIFETGIKVIDLIAPYTRGGKVWSRSGVQA